jgi:hypothetical protein
MKIATRVFARLLGLASYQRQLHVLIAADSEASLKIHLSSLSLVTTGRNGKLTVTVVPFPSWLSTRIFPP